MDLLVLSPPQTTSEAREGEKSQVASLEATIHSLESQLEETRQVSVHVRTYLTTGYSQSYCIPWYQCLVITHTPCQLADRRTQTINELSVQSSKSADEYQAKLHEVEQKYTVELL